MPKTTSMQSTPEHQFISQQLDFVLKRFSQTALLGITEAQRRTFDYACVLLRDFSRPLVSQVLWSHEPGLDKDVRTLLHDGESLIKVYFVKNNLRIRQKLDEVLASYRGRPETENLLRGLRVIPIAPDFDADKPQHRQWMANHLESVIGNDIVFNVVFGRLIGSDVRKFADHGGPLGLKYAILDEVTRNGLSHMPTFKERLGYGTNGPIREALTMLAATGLIQRLERTNIHVPTIKGRLLLDLTKLLLFEVVHRSTFSADTLLILRCLGFEPFLFEPDLPIDDRGIAGHPLVFMIQYAIGCKRYFGRDLLNDVDSVTPRFHTEYSLQEWRERAHSVYQVYPSVLAEPDAVFFLTDS